MPRYEYICHFCDGQKFTLNKPMQEAKDPVTCPQCDYPAERVFSKPAVRVYGGTPKHHGA